MLADITNTLNNLPHKGDTPIFLTSTATLSHGGRDPHAPDGPRGEIVVNMSRGSFEDMGAILITLNRLATNAGLVRP